MPLAAAQSEWVCDHLAGRYALPDRRRRCGRTSRPSASGCSSATSASKRHTMQVDYDDYLADLEKERRRGAERARERGFALPVPPRARPEVAPA